MRIFIAGASGAVGQPLVRRLGEAGHEVTGMTRTPEKVALARSCSRRSLSRAMAVILRLILSASAHCRPPQSGVVRHEQADSRIEEAAP